MTPIARPAVFLLLALFACVANAAGAADQRWALLASDDLRQSGAAEVISASLREVPSVAWLEREQLRVAADELSTGAILSSGGVARRLELGQQLRADVLLIVATEVTEYRRVVRVVVSDSGSGARLLEERLAAPDGDAAALGAAVRAVVERARTHFAGGVSCVVGVPDFVSRDFTHEFDHHQAAYAALLAHALAAQPGVAVLEVDEARALAAEVRAERIDRRFVPLLVEGEYRVTRRTPADEPTVDFKFNIVAAASGGGVGPTSFERRGVPMSRAAAYIADELPQAILKPASLEVRPALSPAGQFAALVARADTFARLGAWEHSMPLREAALLLTPGDAGTRIAAADEYIRLLERRHPRDLSWKKDGAELERHYAKRATYWSAVLTHLEFLIRNRQVHLEPMARLLQRATICMNRFPEPAVEALLPQMRQLEQEKRDFLRHVSAAALQLPREDKYGRPASHHGWGLWHNEVVRLGLLRIDDPKRQNPSGPHVPVDLEWWGELYTQVLPDVPVTSSALGDAIYGLANDVSQDRKRGVTRQQFVAFLDGLSAASSRQAELYARLGHLWLRWASVRSDQKHGAATAEDDARAEAVKLLADAEQRLPRGYRGSIDNYAQVLIADIDSRTKASVAKVSVAKAMPTSGPRRSTTARTPRPRPAPASAPAAAAGLLRFEPLAVRLRDAQGRETPLPARWQRVEGNGGGIKQFLACDGRFDVLFAPEVVLLHREKGVFDQALDEPGAGFTSVAWDGQHVWAASQHKGVWVLDPDGRTIARVTDANGLPPADGNLLLVAVSPGKVLAVGSHGESRRAWVGTLELAAAGTVRVNVFHRATRVAKADEKQAEKDAELCFYPSFVEPLRTAGSDAVTGVLIGRAAADVSAARWPLQVDVERSAVSVRHFPSLIAQTPDHYLLGDGRILRYFMRDICLFDAPTEGAGYHPLFRADLGGTVHGSRGFLYRGAIYFPGFARWCRVDAASLHGEIINVDAGITAPLPPPPSRPGQGQPTAWQGIGGPQGIWSRYGVSAHWGVVMWNPLPTEFQRVVLPTENAATLP